MRIIDKVAQSKLVHFALPYLDIGIRVRSDSGPQLVGLHVELDEGSRPSGNPTLVLFVRTQRQVAVGLLVEQMKEFGRDEHSEARGGEQTTQALLDSKGGENPLTVLFGGESGQCLQVFCSKLCKRVKLRGLEELHSGIKQKK